jgi:hypothetical protein
MPELEDPREELYAISRSQGMFAVDAYQRATGHHARGTASKWDAKPHIRMRVRELLAEIRKSALDEAKKRFTREDLQTVLALIINAAKERNPKDWGDTVILGAIREYARLEGWYPVDEEAPVSNLPLAQLLSELRKPGLPRRRPDAPGHRRSFPPKNPPAG